MWEPTSGPYFYGINKKILRKSSNLDIISYGFPKEKNTYGNYFLKDGLVHLGTVLFTQ
jgi:hypothetical protein